VTAAGCQSAPAPLTTSGIVVDVAGAGLAQVIGFSLRTAGGEVLSFEVDSLSLAGGGKPAPHLREHMASGSPITVEYRVEGTDGAQRLIAIRYFDAPPATATATSSASAATSSPASPTLSGQTGSPPLPGGISLVPVGSGFGALVLLTHAGDGTGQIHVVEQEGRIRVGGTDGAFMPEPYLDISERVGFGGERGLLGLAFHPDYAVNGRLFVNYSNLDGDNVIAEFTRQPGCECADPASERALLTIEQPFANHNGGMLVFGPDGYLYISSGDGGSGGDPQGNGQDLGTLLGKILRIDVDATDGASYGIPVDNPFAGGDGGARPEIWSYGLRNPWRVTFDRQTGDMFIGDVGQGSFEEVDAEPAGSSARNYGWNVMEGPECFATTDCDRAGLTLPVAWYAHSDAICAVTGGYVYRGSAVPGLAGTYLFSDYCAGTVWGIDAAAAVAGAVLEPVVLTQTDLRVSSFGEDEAGELYLVSHDGRIVRVAPADR
jgi:glucose/arabinose dehydrogenase